jgi:hypothetical protein
MKRCAKRPEGYRRLSRGAKTTSRTRGRSQGRACLRPFTLKGVILYLQGIPLDRARRPLISFVELLDARALAGLLSPPNQSHRVFYNCHRFDKRPNGSLSRPRRPVKFFHEESHLKATRATILSRGAIFGEHFGSSSERKRVKGCSLGSHYAQSARVIAPNRSKREKSLKRRAWRRPKAGQGERGGRSAFIIAHRDSTSKCTRRCRGEGAENYLGPVIRGRVDNIEFLSSPSSIQRESFPGAPPPPRFPKASGSKWKVESPWAYWAIKTAGLLPISRPLLMESSHSSELSEIRPRRRGTFPPNTFRFDKGPENAASSFHIQTSKLCIILCISLYNFALR